jgi:ferredoxin
MSKPVDSWTLAADRAFPGVVAAEHGSAEPQRSAYGLRRRSLRWRTSVLPMLLSEAINRHAGAREHGVILTEQNLVFACDSCGRSTTAEDLEVAQLGADCVYSCPTDNATLARVDAHGAYSFRGGLLTIRIATEEIAWSDFLSSIHELAE